MTYSEIIERLHALADKDKVAFKQQKFGVVANNALGVYQKDLKALAKEIGQDNDLAIQLFDSGIYEGRILCSKLFNPKDLTEELIEKWVSSFENWEICDSFCMGLIAKSKWAVPKINEWVNRTPEFEKRSGFTTIAAYCMADKKSGNDVFELFFPMIKASANDDRVYVKKAVNWALRNIGKRNIDLKKRAIEVSNELLDLNTKPALWIAKDALRELQKEGCRVMDYPRHIYRAN